MMKIVGEKLEHIAKTEKDLSNKDLYGRSAFNRYYYAAFLVTRQMLGDLDQKWKYTAHKEIPNLLITGVRKPAINKLKKNSKSDIITNGESSVLRSKLTTATADLANLLTQAYYIRLVADYKPETLILIENNVISLDSHKLTSARTWPDRTNIYCKEIRKVWRDSGLA